jgi:hypothetical protein
MTLASIEVRLGWRRRSERAVSRVARDVLKQGGNRRADRLADPGQRSEMVS